MKPTGLIRRTSPMAARMISAATKEGWILRSLAEPSTGLRTHPSAHCQQYPRMGHPIAILWPASVHLHKSSGGSQVGPAGGKMGAVFTGGTEGQSLADQVTRPATPL